MKYKSFTYYSENCPVPWDYSEDYEIVVNMETNKVVCMLGEPEDKTFTRDLSKLLNVLNEESKLHKSDYKLKPSQKCKPDCRYSESMLHCGYCIRDKEAYQEYELYNDFYETD